MIDVEGYLKTKIQPDQKYAVLGIGSILRSDDAAGMYFIEQLSNLIKKEKVLLIAGSTAPENFTGEIKSFAPDQLFIVDAAHMGLSPGETRVLFADDISGVSFSTHMLPLPIMLKYLELEVRCDVTFVGIQPRHVDQGFSMSDAVKKGTEQLVDLFYNLFETV